MAENSEAPLRTALYARVSGADQRLHQTIDGQITALHNAAPHSGLTIVKDYLDDGISGTVPLEKRPAGQELTEDAKIGNFDVVFFYKTDRLARSLQNFLDILAFFKEIGVGMKSLTEPFDTTGPMGTFIVQMLACIAELERGTILERTTMGRERVAAQGRWTGGVVPFGYLVDDEGLLTPDVAPINGLTFSESDVVRRIFHMMAEEHSTTTKIAMRLNQEGIPAGRKYHRRSQANPNRLSTPQSLWAPSTIGFILKAPTYKGLHFFGQQKIEREVPALIDVATWDKAQLQLTKNRTQSTSPSHHQYLLRALMTCEACGSSYQGTTANAPGRPTLFYYRCGFTTAAKRVRGEKCQGKLIRAERIEDLVWADITHFVMNPGEALQRLREQVEDALHSIPDTLARAKELQQAITTKKQEGNRMLDLYRIGRINQETLEDQLDRSAAELEPLEAELAAIVLDEAERGRKVGGLADSETILLDLREVIDKPMDWDTKRQIVERLVIGIKIRSVGVARKKKAIATVTYRFNETAHEVATSTTRSNGNSTTENLVVTHEIDYWKPVKPMAEQVLP